MKKLTNRIENKNCETPDEMLLSQYLDQKLNEEERDKVQKHLIHCSKCRTLLIETTRSIKLERENSKEEDIPLKPVNNINYYKALSPLMTGVAIFIVFISVPIIDPEQNHIQYKGVEIEKNILDESMEYWERLYEKYFGK